MKISRRNSIACRLGIGCLAMLIGMVVASCGDAEYEYSSSRCYLIIDNSQHQDATLASAMNPMAPGVFCLISETMSGGATFFSFQSNLGTSSKTPENAYDQRRSLILGYNNGLIVGFGNLDVPPVFYAFDAECPNCFDPDAIPVRSKRLQMTDTGLAVCNTCKRQYNLNTGGNIVTGDGGKKLTRYRGATNGPFTVLSVN